MNGTTSVPGLLAALILLSLLALLVVFLCRTLTDAIGLFAIAFGVFYVFRMLLITTGLDGPSPDYLYSATDTAPLVTRTVLALCAFVLMVGVGAAAILAVLDRGTSRSSVLFVKHEVPLRAMLAMTLALTLVTLVISAVLISRFGGFGGLVTAAKVDKELSGLYFLKIPMYVGAIVATAAVLDLRRRKAPGGWVWFAAGCAVIDSVMVFAWGQRSALIIVIAMLLLGGLHDARSKHPHFRQSIGRLALAAVLVVSLAAGLRIVRDQLTAGEVNDIYASASPYRQASLAVNGNYFDASLLAFRDWPDSQEFRRGEDFYNGVVGAVPRALLPSKPEPASGVWFRQIYEPKNVNGWPVGAPTIWFLNFGYGGLLLGGLLSGALLGWVAQRQRHHSASAINTGVSFVLGLLVLQLGVPSDVASRALTWLAPLLIIVALLNVVGTRARGQSSRSSMDRSQSALKAHA